MKTINKATLTDQQLNECSKDRLVSLCKVLMEQNKEISTKLDNLIQQINLSNHRRFGSSSEKDKFKGGSKLWQKLQVMELFQQKNVYFL